MTVTQQGGLRSLELSKAPRCFRSPAFCRGWPHTRKEVFRAQVLLIRLKSALASCGPLDICTWPTRTYNKAVVYCW